MKLYEKVEGKLIVYECEAKKEDLIAYRKKELENLELMYPHIAFEQLLTSSSALKNIIIQGQNYSYLDIKNAISLSKIFANKLNRNHPYLPSWELIDDMINFDDSTKDWNNIELYMPFYAYSRDESLEHFINMHFIESYINGNLKDKKVTRFLNNEKRYRTIDCKNGHINLLEPLEFIIKDKKFYYFPKLLGLPKNLCALQYFEQGDYAYLARQFDSVDFCKSIPDVLYSNSLKQISEYEMNDPNCPQITKRKEEMEVSTLILNRIKRWKTR